MSKLSLTLSIAALALLAVPAAAGTVHTEFYYSGTDGTNDGMGLYPDTPHAFSGSEADSASVDFSYQTNDPGSFGQNTTADLVASQDVYWAESGQNQAQGLYSDWAFDADHYGTGSLQISLSANPGSKLTNLSFDVFCGRSAGCEGDSYKFFSVVGGVWSLISGGSVGLLDGSGDVVTLSALIPDLAQVVFQLGSDGSVGVDNVKYDVSTVPLPGAVVLFGSALAGVAGIGYRRRSALAA